MSDEITFYHNPMSRGRIVHWMLEEVGAPYRIELTRFDKGEHKSPALLRLNPMGKLPTIVHKGVVISEAAAICTYLADAFPAAQLAPPIGDPARGSYLRWLFFGAGCLEPALTDRGFRRAPVRASAIGYGSYDDTLRALESAITPGPYILGERFSAADVYVGAGMGWGMQSGSLEPRASFRLYMARLLSRPASQRAAKQNLELLAQLRT